MTRTLRGIPADTILGYLRDYESGVSRVPNPADDDHAGGRETDPVEVRGAGWSARVTPLAPVSLGSIELSRVELTVEAEEPVMSRLAAYLDVRLARGGG